MSRSFGPDKKKLHSTFFFHFFQPAKEVIPQTPALESHGNRPLQLNIEDQLKILVFYHLEEHVSARHVLQVLEQDDFARENIAPQDDIKNSSFSEAINSRGLEQLQIIFEKLSQKASCILLNQHPELGNLVENAIRPFVVSRKNWLFSVTPQGANASAAIYSLRAYLKNVKYFSDTL